MKILTAVALHKPLVTVEWLEAFADESRTSGAAVPIPSVRDFFPLTDVLQLRHPEASRERVFEGMTFLLVHASHEQYSSLIRLCGGDSVRLHKRPTSQWRDLVTEAASSDPRRRLFVLTDDTVRMDSQVPHTRRALCSAHLVP